MSQSINMRYHSIHVLYCHALEYHAAFERGIPVLSHLATYERIVFEEWAQILVLLNKHRIVAIALYSIW